MFYESYLSLEKKKKKKKEKKITNKQKTTLAWKEKNYLFDNALNIFYFRLYDVGDLVKYHSDSETGNPLSLIHGLLFPISNKRFFYMHHP